MNDLTARLIIVSEADNYQYAGLKRDEENAYQVYKDIFCHSERMKSDIKHYRPHYHWHDWSRLSEIARKPFWDAKIPIETRLQLINEFEQKTNKLLFGALVGHFEREEEMNNEDAEYMTKCTLNHGLWLDDAYICHKIDSIVRSALIKINMPSSSGFSSRLKQGVA